MLRESAWSTHFCARAATSMYACGLVVKARLVDFLEVRGDAVDIGDVALLLDDALASRRPRDPCSSGP